MSQTTAARFDEAVPRYTSYPTAPHFTPAVGAAEVTDWLKKLPADEAVSIYVHVPFCDRLCWFCACHTKQTLRYDPVARFLPGLHDEIALVREHLPGRLAVRSLHFGGGSPTMLRPADMIALKRSLEEAFDFGPETEISVEADPNDMDAERFDALCAVGVTRASLGVQDFAPGVQKAINRDQTFEQTRATVEGFRARGVKSINLDLLYGLPHQTLESLAETVRLALSLEPDRLALFGYAHVPWFKTHQRMIDENALPTGPERFAQSQLAARAFVDAGYVPIGIDHFARPGDSLAAAAKGGRLHRNFQGYTDDACETLIGFGPSAISRFREGYAQTVPATGTYLAMVGRKELPAVRGLALGTEDHIRAWLIERLMCDFAISEADLVERFGPSGSRILHGALPGIASRGYRFEKQDDVWRLAEADRPFVRLVASAFDEYLPLDAARHSAAV